MAGPRAIHEFCLLYCCEYISLAAVLCGIALYQRCYCIMTAFVVSVHWLKRSQGTGRRKWNAKETCFVVGGFVEVVVKDC